VETETAVKNTLTTLAAADAETPLLMELLVKTPTLTDSFALLLVTLSPSPNQFATLAPLLPLLDHAELLLLLMIPPLEPTATPLLR